MKLPVIYSDGTPGAVTPGDLETLIRTGSVLSFKRSSGWVRVNVDPIRGSDYSRPYNPARERRVNC